jgi:magnesium chelatase accessory protein
MGQGPVLLLVHGTGAATHSWRDLAPLLAEHFTLVAPDLPGHGFSQTPAVRGLSLPGMADTLKALLDQLQTPPELVLGHSAGAAILARMCLDAAISPKALISLNGALLPLGGLAGHWFSPAAKLLAANPLVPQLLARQADSPRAVQRLVDSTGSRLDARGLELYRRLMSTPGHVAATLKMMANWDLAPLVRDLPRLRTPLVLVVAERDGTVRPAEASRVRALIPTAETIHLPGLGHLAHEERPRLVADLVLSIAARHGVPTAATQEPGPSPPQGPEGPERRPPGAATAPFCRSAGRFCIAERTLYGSTFFGSAGTRARLLDWTTRPHPRCAMTDAINAAQPTQSPPAQPEPSRGVLAALRAATAPTHAAVERLPIMARLTSPAVTAADYCRYLRAMARVYGSLEPPLYAAVGAGLSLARVDALGLRPKLPALHADLAALGLEPPAPEPGSAPAELNLALGGLYVLEGATLGGRVIARHLRRRLGEPLIGGTFLDFHGDQSAAAWRRFGRALEALEADGSLSPDQAVLGACTVFAQVWRMLGLPAVHCRAS